jgi:hypothetical protein
MDYETHNGHTHPPEKEEPIFMAIMAARRLRETGKKSQLQVNLYFKFTK